MKTILFSRFFPAYHPRKGEPTYFVEKIWKGLYDNEPSNYIPFNGYWQRYDETFPTGETFKAENNIHSYYPKSHTIRAGNRWKVGDYFSPRVWSGLPYRSKQIEFAPPIEIKKIWNFEMDLCGVYSIGGFYPESLEVYDTLAQNDGLTNEDMQYWFMPNSNKPKEFSGQIICWNEKINY